MSERVLCALSELDRLGTKAFSVGSGPWPLRGFLVRQGDQVFAYVNRCPHAGHPLNMRPDEFLSVDRRYILCNSHGALFEIANGACVAGPCAGRSLTPLPVRVAGELVVLDADPDELARLYS